MLSTKVVPAYTDMSSETATQRMYVQALAGDGSNMAAVLSDASDLIDALQAASDAGLYKYTVRLYHDPELAIAPADETAQNEYQLLVGYADTVTMKTYTVTFPGPVDTLLQVNTDEIDIDANLVADAFRDALEANCESEAGNPIQVLYMRYVGRNV